MMTECYQLFSFGITQGESGCGEAAFQASVQHFFDAMQLRAPQLVHVVEALVDAFRWASMAVNFGFM